MFRFKICPLRPRPAGIFDSGVETIVLNYFSNEEK